VAATQPQGQIKGDYKNFFTRKQDSNQLHIQMVRNSLSERLPNIDLNTMINYALDYPSKLSKQPVKPVRSILTASYSTLLLKEAAKELGPTPPWAKLLSEEFSYLRNLERYRSDLAYIRDYKSQFVSYDERPLATRIADVSKAIDDVIEWGVECYRTQGKNCEKSVPPRLGLSNLSPLRADPWLPKERLNPKISTWQPVGETLPGYDMVLETKGRWRFGHELYKVLPITQSTGLQLIDRSDVSRKQELKTQISQVIPSNRAVYFRFIDKPDSYGDNDYVYDDPATVRLGGKVDAFILGGQGASLVPDSP
jgi:hypothetical protein